MELIYESTRNADEKVTASQAILKGLANDGGLFVPSKIPALAVDIDELAKMTYQETAYAVMSKFLTDFTEEELKNCIDAAYDSKFDTKEIAPLVSVDNAYYLELFHGSTIETQERQPLLDLRMWKEPKSLCFIQSMASARFRKSRWLHKKEKIHLS